MDNKLSKEQINQMIIVFCKLQSLLHDTDQLLETDIKREIKVKIINFNRWLESTLNLITKQLDSNSTDIFINMTNEFDEIGEKFNSILKTISD